VRDVSGGCGREEIDRHRRAEGAGDGFQDVFVAPGPGVDEEVRCRREQLHELDEAGGSVGLGGDYRGRHDGGRIEINRFEGLVAGGTVGRRQVPLQEWVVGY
jgi:hypothetical protein